MGQQVLGISIGRNTIAVACVKIGRWKIIVEYSVQLDRGNFSASVALARALEHVPPGFHASRLQLALSAGDLDCADCFEVPFRSEAQMAAVSGSLAEERCAGRSIEELALDFQYVKIDGKAHVRLLALSHQKLSELGGVVRKALPKARLSLVTASVVALAEILRVNAGTLALCAHGEAFVIRTNKGKSVGWRSFPVNLPYTFSDLTAVATAFSPAGTEINVLSERTDIGRIKDCDTGLVIALAVAQLTPGRTLNILRGAKSAPHSVAGRLRGILTFAGAAAALLLLCTGFYFSLQIHSLEARGNLSNEFERRLWNQRLPHEKYVPGTLSNRVKKLLVQHNKSVDVNKFPSALAFWSEIAAVLPDADRLGLVLESLQLGPDGGRLSGRVSKGATDPLSNASQLETALANSTALSAHGEFETGANDIAVRMRLEFPKLGLNSFSSIPRLREPRP